MLGLLLAAAAVALLLGFSTKVAHDRIALLEKQVEKMEDTLGRMLGKK